MALLKESVARFVRERLVPVETAVDESGVMPSTVREGMCDLGLFGISIPETYGGLGLTLREEVELVFDLGQTSPVFRSVVGTNIGIGSQGIILDGTEEQKRQYLPKLASGELIASFALTEPESGSDARSIRALARRDGDGYVLNGTKRFITNAPHAGLFTVIARTMSVTKEDTGISAFLVERDAPGISLGRPYRKMGQHGSDVCDVIFDNCRVSETSLLGGREGQGFATALKVLDRGRVHIAAVCVGAATRLIAESLRYACERRQFGQRIIEFQLIQAMLADSQTETYAARTMVLDAATRHDQGEKISLEASCASCLRRKWWGALPTAPFRYLAVRDILRNILSNDFTVMSGYSGSMRVQVRSSRYRSPSIWRRDFQTDNQTARMVHDGEEGNYYLCDYRRYSYPQHVALSADNARPDRQRGHCRRRSRGGDHPSPCPPSRKGRNVRLSRLAARDLYGLSAAHQTELGRHHQHHYGRRSGNDLRGAYGGADGGIAGNHLVQSWLR
jgi:acyl-CoA dehydrogenase